MNKEIKISDIYDKNVNFLIGSGASHGLFPTLALGLKADDNSKLTIETLATQFSDAGKDGELVLLFAHYFETCIKPAMLFDLKSAMKDENQLLVAQNYRKFIRTILAILQRKKQNKRCNVFTTNYDGCFVHLADEILREDELDFTINDGAAGFGRRIVQAKNFNRSIFETGVFERHQIEIPQINLIHLHGSVYWWNRDGKIWVSYRKELNEYRCKKVGTFEDLKKFSDVLLDETKTIKDLPILEVDSDKIVEFWKRYNKLPIVNPTKWKFHETVFEEHYYQMLRHLSYELEKPDTVFITFGFSFADEHILNLVKRSLSNPKLQLFICCFNKIELKWMQTNFSIFKNVSYVTVDEKLDFESFNNKVFKLDGTEQGAEPNEAGGDA